MFAGMNAFVMLISKNSLENFFLFASAFTFGCDSGKLHSESPILIGHLFVSAWVFVPAGCLKWNWSRRRLFWLKSPKFRFGNDTIPFFCILRSILLPSTNYYTYRWTILTDKIWKFYGKFHNRKYDSDFGAYTTIQWKNESHTIIDSGQRRRSRDTIFI